MTNYKKPFELVISAIVDQLHKTLKQNSMFGNCKEPFPVKY